MPNPLTTPSSTNLKLFLDKRKKYSALFHKIHFIGADFTKLANNLLTCKHKQELIIQNINELKFQSLIGVSRNLSISSLRN